MTKSNEKVSRIMRSKALVGQCMTLQGGILFVIDYTCSMLFLLLGL